MKFPVVVAPWLNVSGMAIFPFILVKNEALKNDETLIRHETIHLMQELELLFIPFYLVYLFNYLFNLWRFKNHDQAYLNIIFEREAYACDGRPAYLNERRVWAWLHYYKR